MTEEDDMLEYIRGLLGRFSWPTRVSQGAPTGGSVESAMLLEMTEDGTRMVTDPSDVPPEVVEALRSLVGRLGVSNGSTDVLGNHSKDQPYPPAVVEAVLEDVPPWVTRQVAWDMIPCERVPYVLSELGLVPTSDDVADMEHTASHERGDALPEDIEEALDYSTRAVLALVLPNISPEATADDLSQIRRSYELAAYASLQVMRERGLISWVGAGSEV